MLEVNIQSYGVDDAKFLFPIKANLKPGTIACISGHSGVGKTTLLKCLARIIPDCEPGFVDGSVTFCKKRKYKVSMCFQDPEPQFLWRTLQMEKDFSDFNNKLFDSIAHALDLHKHYKTPLNRLSTGQRKCAALLLALAKPSDVYLLDEPTANLDGHRKKSVLQILKKISKVVIIASHDPELIAAADVHMRLSPPHNAPPNEKSTISVKMHADQAFLSIKAKMPTRGSFAIIGSNGIGKTQLLRKIANEHPPIKISFITQELERQMFELTVKDEISFPDATAKDVQKTIKALHLSAHLKKCPIFISRGQQQLTMIASACSQNVDAIFIDEPFTGLDPAATKRVIELLKSKSRDKIVIVTEQDKRKVDWCDQIIELVPK